MTKKNKKKANFRNDVYLNITVQHMQTNSPYACSAEYISSWAAIHIDIGAPYKLANKYTNSQHINAVHGLLSVCAFVYVCVCDESSSVSLYIEEKRKIKYKTTKTHIGAQLPVKNLSYFRWELHFWFISVGILAWYKSIVSCSRSKKPKNGIFYFDRPMTNQLSALRYIPITRTFFFQNKLISLAL